MTGVPVVRPIGIAGCGAVTELYYAPALQLLEGEGVCRVTSLFDPEAASAARIVRQFPQASRASSYGELLHSGIDLVIIASPPRVHAEQAIAALSSGLAVLCEKPIATNLADGEAIVEAAHASGRIL